MGIKTFEDSEEDDVELTGEVRYYNVRLRGKDYRVIRYIDSNLDSEDIEVLEDGVKEVTDKQLEMEIIDMVMDYEEALYKENER